MRKLVPDVVFRTRVRDEKVGGDNPFRWQDVTTDDIFKDKNIIVFSLPGAFTPTCSSTHLPGFEEKYDELKALGVDEVYCISVNDAFTMFQRSQKLGIKNVKMLPDGNADFTRLMGMLVKKENVGFGSRSWRYSMYVSNGEINRVFSVPGRAVEGAEEPFECSDVDTMLDFLKNQQAHTSEVVN